MHKFWNLIRNEWRKQFLKKSAWVMVVLLTLSALLYGLIVAQSAEAETYDHLQRNCELDIEEYSKFVDQVDANGNLTEFALDCRSRVEMAQFWLDIHATSYDWRYTSDAYNEMIAAKIDGDTATADRIRACLTENDHMAYLQYCKDAALKKYASTPLVLEQELRHWNYAIEHELVPENNNQQYQVSARVSLEGQRLIMYEQRIAEGTLDPEDRDYLNAKNNYAIYSYMLEHEQFANPADALDSSLMSGRYSDESPFWTAFAASDDLSLLVGVFLIVIAGSIVANEFSQGTIKFLLISPVKRWKLLMSKYATVFLMGLMMLGITLAGGFLGALLGGGGQHLSYIAVYAENGIVYTASPFLKILTQYLWGCVEIVIMFSLAFAISSLMRSSAVAIGISLFSLLSGSLLVSLFQGLGFDWARYLIFSNLDLEAIINGSSLFPHHNLFTALLVIALHMVVFLWTAIDGFVRREV